MSVGRDFLVRDLDEFKVIFLLSSFSLRGISSFVEGGGDRVGERVSLVCLCLVWRRGF